MKADAPNAFRFPIHTCERDGVQQTRSPWIATVADTAFLAMMRRLSVFHQDACSTLSHQGCAWH